MMLDILNALIGLTIVGRLIMVADTLNGRTRHCFRFTLVVLAGSALAWALWPFYGEWPEWADTVFIASVAAYVLLDRRKAQRDAQPS